MAEMLDEACIQSVKERTSVIFESMKTHNAESALIYLLSRQVALMEHMLSALVRLEDSAS